VGPDRVLAEVHRGMARVAARGVEPAVLAQPGRAPDDGAPGGALAGEAGRRAVA
jgi:hypothetical protein